LLLYCTQIDVGLLGRALGIMDDLKQGWTPKTVMHLIQWPTIF